MRPLLHLAPPGNAPGLRAHFSARLLPLTGGLGRVYEPPHRAHRGGRFAPWHAQHVTAKIRARRARRCRCDPQVRPGSPPSIAGSFVPEAPADDGCGRHGPPTKRQARRSGSMRGMRDNHPRTIWPVNARALPDHVAGGPWPSSCSPHLTSASGAGVACLCSMRRLARLSPSSAQSPALEPLRSPSGDGSPRLGFWRASALPVRALARNSTRRSARGTTHPPDPTELANLSANPLDPVRHATNPTAPTAGPFARPAWPPARPGRSNPCARTANPLNSLDPPAGPARPPVRPAERPARPPARPNRPTQPLKLLDRPIGPLDQPLRAPARPAVSPFDHPLGPPDLPVDPLDRAGKSTRATLRSTRCPARLARPTRTAWPAGRPKRSTRPAAPTCRPRHNYVYPQPTGVKIAPFRPNGVDRH